MNRPFYNETEAAIKKIKASSTPVELVAPGSSYESPLTLSDAHIFSAYWLARAANDLQDSHLLSLAEGEFGKVKSWADHLVSAVWNPFAASNLKEDEYADHEGIQAIVHGNLRHLQGHSRALEIGMIINRMGIAGEPESIQYQKNVKAIDAEDTHISDALKKTYDETMTPFNLAAGLWKGMVPPGMDPNTFKMVQVGVYGSLIAAALGVTYIYVRPFLPKRD